MTDDEIRASFQHVVETFRGAWIGRTEVASGYTGKADPDNLIRLIAEVIARSGRIAVNMLGVSLEFFDEHIDPEIPEYPAWPTRHLSDLGAVGMDGP